MKKTKERSIIIAAIVCLAIVAIVAVVATTLKNESNVVAKGTNSDRDYLIVVNDDHPYEFGGDYDKTLQDDLVYLPDAYGEPTLVEKGTAKAFLELEKALYDKGMIIGLYTGYLTKENQQGIYDYYSNLEGWSETNTVRKPGFSEHHTGLVLNVLIWYQGEGDETPIWYTETAERQEKIAYFKTLHETLADYGFIDRYPKGKEDITGVLPEPYEIRFVGSSKIAHEIMDNNLCLEEFVK